MVNRLAYRIGSQASESISELCVEPYLLLSVRCPLCPAIQGFIESECPCDGSVRRDRVFSNNRFIISISASPCHSNQLLGHHGRHQER